MAELNFDALFRSASLEMHAAFERSIASFRPDEKGNNREDAVRHFFKDWLPDGYGISKGYVVDDNIVSKECDIVIFNKEKCPKFFLSKETDVRIFPIAYVYCTIEVKSKLTVKELENALMKLKSINDVHQRYIRQDYKKEVFKEEINLLLTDYDSLNSESTIFKNLRSFKNNDFSGHKGILLKQREYSDRPIRVIFSFDWDNKLPIDEIKNKVDQYEYMPDLIFSLKHGTVFQLTNITLSRFYSMENRVIGREYRQYSSFALLNYTMDNPNSGNYYEALQIGKSEKNLMFFYAMFMDLLNHHYQSSDINPVADIIAIWQKNEDE